MILAVSTFQVIAALLFALFSMLLMIVVLLQRGKGVGLAGAFGGAGGTAAFGTKTGDMLTWITIVMFAIFIMLAVALNFLFAAGKATISAPAAATENAPIVETQMPEPSEQGVNEPPITVTPTQTNAPAAGLPENPATPAESTDSGNSDADPEDTPSEPGAMQFPPSVLEASIFA